MSVGNVVGYVGIIAFVIYRRVAGNRVGSAKQLFVLPVVLSVLGYHDVMHKPLDGVDIGFAVAGCAVSVALGAVRGRLDKVFIRDGQPWMRWGTGSVLVFVATIGIKFVLDLLSVAAGGTTSGATSSLLLAAGLMLLGEAVVVWLRVGATLHPASWPVSVRSATPPSRPVDSRRIDAHQTSALGARRMISRQRVERR